MLHFQFAIEGQTIGASVAQWAFHAPLRLRVRFSVRTFSMLLEPSVLLM